jgi:hypothetical protein
MSSTDLDTRRDGSPLHVRVPMLRCLPVALALLLACSRGADRGDAPRDALHYPAWLSVSGDQLLVVNTDQDLAFDGGSIIGLDPAAGTIAGSEALPYMAGKLRVVSADDAASCDLDLGGASSPVSLPYALVAGRSDSSLYFIGLPFAAGMAASRNKVDLRPQSAAHPFDVALGCGADRKARGWVSYQRGVDDRGYVAQVDLSGGSFPPGVVQVFTGDGPPRSFAWDRDHDRLYFTTREFRLRAPIRWIGVGNGCKAFPDGVQDEARGGCHVDPGFDLSAHLAGAEPNAIALASQERECVFGGGTRCRRMYATVRIYDADFAKVLGKRPTNDIGGKLVILELEESTLGGPEVRWIDDVDIGKIAGEVLVIPRPEGDLLVATAVTDNLVWIYDDARGAVAKVFGRLPSGAPELGHQPAGLASVDMGGGVVRVFVASYEDHWVSAIDVRLDDPTAAYVVRAGPNPADPTAPYLRLGRPQ